MITVATDVRRPARRSGGVLVAAGAISIAAGVLALAYPDITLLVLALIGGCNLIMLGAVALWDAVTEDADATVRALAAIAGVVGVMAGIVVIKRPGASLLAILLILGLWLVVHGIVELVHAMSVPEDRAAHLLGALADVVLGVLILALPDLSLTTLAVLVGIAFVLRGALTVWAGLRLRRQAPA